MGGRLPWLFSLAMACHAATGYAGARACARCHQKIYDSYLRTAMGRSVSAAVNLPAAPAAIHNETLHRDFGVFRRDGQLWQSESRPGVFQNEHRLEYAIGSGENGISYAVRRGDYLFQAPLSWYARTGSWALSPGFEQTDAGFNRPIYDACITCHAGRPQAVPGGDGLYRDPPFAEMAIGCENCHGPGAAHAQSPDQRMVDPARLPPRLAEDICMRCHQGGDARVLLPGKQYGDFRPGTPLLDTVAIFALPANLQDADLLQHHAAMKASRCFRSSGGKLSCLTCHDPHQQPDAASAPAWFRARCLRCHTERSCRLALAARRRNAIPDNCIGCHMPKRDVRMISHSELTNHRIPARPGAPAQLPPVHEDLPGLALLDAQPGAPPLPLLTRLAAYGELMDRDPSLRPRYLAVLDQAAHAAPNDPLVLAALGRKALAEGHPEAVDFLSRAEQKGATAAATYVDLGEALARSGRAADSAAALERGARRFPFSEPIRKHLILAYIRQRDFARAGAALERYVQDFPEDDFMRGLLAKLHPASR